MKKSEKMYKAKVFYVPESIYVYPEEELGNEEMMIASIQQEDKLSSYMQEQKVERGSVIVFGEEDGYRNDFRFMYDGVQIVNLDYNPPFDYDYGIVPREFVCIREFPIGYWDEALHGWNMNWIPCSDTLQEEIVNNAVPYFGDNVYKSMVEIEGKSIEVYIETREHTFEECITNYFTGHRSGALLCVMTYNDSTEADLPRGANIIHIMDE